MNLKEAWEGHLSGFIFSQTLHLTLPVQDHEHLMHAKVNILMIFYLTTLGES